jgi:cytochrome c oxidase subunit 1
MAGITGTFGEFAQPREHVASHALQSENRLVIAHVYVGTISVVIGAFFGLLQVLSRADALNAPPWFDYYRMLTAHGVLMAIVFTTFYITGLATYITYRSVPHERSLVVGWLGWWVMIAGTLMAAYEILAGNATVLYTFYAPLKASPWFYVGTTMLVVGTWIVAVDLFSNVFWWRRAHKGEMLPLPAFTAASTFLMWWIATLGVAVEMLFQLIPWAFGWTPGVNVELSRILFWYFGHPLVYFWIMGAYMIWYNVVPTYFGGKLFSDSLTRLTFILLILLSTPVGLHHEFTEPGIADRWKMLHTITTYFVVIPSLLTAFGVFASFELWAHHRGKKGFWATAFALPWNDPAFAGAGYAMLLFIVGGFGGLINASYSMNLLVHNTVWVVGHFHVTVGGPVALTLISSAYWLVPKLTGRQLWNPNLALWQVRLWFVGMLIFSFALHFAGLLGSPRRTANVDYMGNAVAASWHPYMLVAAAGGTILFISALMFACVAIGTYLTNRKTASMEVEFAEPSEMSGDTPLWDQAIFRWGAIALVLAILAYLGPILELMHTTTYLAPGMRTW